MGGLWFDRWSETVFLRFLPPQRAQAPPVPRPQTREVVLWTGRGQVVAFLLGVIEKLLGDHRADHVRAPVVLVRVAEAVPHETGFWTHAAGLQGSSQDVLCHNAHLCHKMSVKQ